MKIKFNSIFFISLLLLPTYNTVTSEPEGVGVFVLSVDKNEDIKGLAQNISRAIERKLGEIRERMGRGVRKELERYVKFEREIADELDRFDVETLQGLAQKNFPDIYPAYIKDPKVYDKHPALWQIYKLMPFTKPKSGEKKELTGKQATRAKAAAKKAQAKIDKSKTALMNYLHRTKAQFEASQKLAGIIPTKTLHITFCECGATGCSKRNLKRLFSKFYDTKTRYVEFTIEDIEVYDEGPGWVVLNIKSSYLDKVIQRLRKNGTFQCTVRKPFQAHISILRFDGFERGQRNATLQLFREFLITAGPDLLRDPKKRYCIDIKEFGIKKRDIKYLYSS